MRNRRSHKKRGGALANFGNAVFSGIKQGFKNAPKQIYSSLRSSGSSYLTPSGSITNYAGNNIQNIIKSHNESFRKNMGNKLNTFKSTIKTTNKNKKMIQYPMMRSFTPRRNFTSKIGTMNFKKYNNKYTYSNKNYKNNKNTNQLFYSNIKFNNKSKQQLV